MKFFGDPIVPDAKKYGTAGVSYGTPRCVRKSYMACLKHVTLKHGNVNFRKDFRLELVPSICYSSAFFTMLSFVLKADVQLYQYMSCCWFVYRPHPGCTWQIQPRRESHVPVICTDLNFFYSIHFPFYIPLRVWLGTLQGCHHAQCPLPLSIVIRMRMVIKQWNLPACIAEVQLQKNTRAFLT